MVTKNECLMVIYILKILRREPNTWLSSVWWEPRKIFISYSPSCQWYPLYFLWSWPEKLGKVAATSSLLSSFPYISSLKSLDRYFNDTLANALNHFAPSGFSSPSSYKGQHEMNSTIFSIYLHLDNWMCGCKKLLNRTDWLLV